MVPALDIIGSVTAAIAMLVAGLRDDPGPADGYFALDAINSHIVMHTRRIDRVVAIGPWALDPLIHEMSRPDVSVDTFVRCYSACDQILCNAGLKEGVRWHGGHIEMDRKSRRVVRTSRIDGFSKEFRQEQIDDIVRGAKQRRIIILRFLR